MWPYWLLFLVSATLAMMARGRKSAPMSGLHFVRLDGIWLALISFYTLIIGYRFAHRMHAVRDLDELSRSMASFWIEPQSLIANQPLSRELRSLLGDPLPAALSDDASVRMMAQGARRLLTPFSTIRYGRKLQKLRKLMPLTDTPWAHEECGYKLTQYMPCGLPVIASPAGVNCEIVEYGVNGFLAETYDDWHKALTTLMSNPGLRWEMGQATRMKVQQKYSIRIWGPKVVNILQSAAKWTGKP